MVGIGLGLSVLAKGALPRLHVQVPVSQCSRQCKEGQVRRVKGFHSCCYDCEDCKAGSYQKHPGEPPSLDSPHS